MRPIGFANIAPVIKFLQTGHAVIATHTPQESGASARRPPAVEIRTIQAEEAGQRVDNFLLRALPGVPKSKIYNIVRRGEVRVNQGRVKPSYRLQDGDALRIPPVRVGVRDEVPAAPRQLQALAQMVLHEDDELLVLNKPAGLAVHGGSGVSLGLIELLRQQRPEARFLELVHRLDRDTSGCVMVAKRRRALLELQQALQSGQVDKRYQLLVAGAWPAAVRRVDAPLRKNILSSGERLVRVDSEGKPACTEFRVLERFAQATLLEARPITGRTHQIRVHARQQGHPIAGDPKYGDAQFDAALRGQGLQRLFLHAWRLELKLPSRNAPLRLEAPLEASLAAVLARLAKAGTDASPG
ncbi:MAG: 23S rRNA pseudouridine(955/2504/2580) synthase RluC [Pseudomonadales bacterium]|jgi:23S rRNA pseudouridine955/2504/2580 synthase|nr:23S rRNA pseudouridine(955/2504/2580) synthase RluC [Pseudomonadales bacterium]MCP5332344.1 23S rRNA pseudouridine(955/2504/2580) synthase RluC [Pseudomonadales bacterium]